MRKTYKLSVALALIFILISTGGIIYGNWCGVGLTYDSYDYLAAAASFRDQFVLKNHSGDSFLIHAPFFPLFLSLFEFITAENINRLNAFLFILSSVIIFSTNLPYFKNKLLGSMTVLFVGLSVGQQMVYHFVWTEPMFIFFLALHNFFLIRFLDNKKISDLSGLIFCAFFMTLTRNAGFFIVLPVTLILYNSFPEKRLWAVYYFILASLGGGMWNIYVIAVQDGIETVYLSNLFFRDIFTNMLNYSETVSLWFLPAIVPPVIRLILLCGGVFCLLYLNYKNVLPGVAKVYFIQAAVYTAVMIVLGKVDVDEIERLLAVIYPWVMVILFLLFDQILLKSGRTARRLLFSLALLWSVYIGTRTYHNLIMWHDGTCHTDLLSTVNRNAHLDF